MPEGPEVRCVAESLNRHLSGKHLLWVGLTSNSRYIKTGKFKGMSLLKYNNYLHSVRVRGKRIIFVFNTPENKKLYLVSFLGMEGKWLQEPSKHTAFSMMFGNIKSITNHDIITEHKMIYYDDSRHFGSLQVYDDSNLEEAFKNIGPDLLNEEVTLEQYISVLTDKKVITKQITSFLLEQKYFSGIGNYLRAEILYAARISPHRLIYTLNEDDITRLHKFSIQILKESYEKNGLTISSYVDPDGTKGAYDAKVYMKKFDPNGYQVIKETFKDRRTTHWVPEIQI